MPLRGSAPSDTRMAPWSSFRFTRPRTASQRQPVATTPPHPLAKDSESADMFTRPRASSQRQPVATPPPNPLAKDSESADIWMIGDRSAKA